MTPENKKRSAGIILSGTYISASMISEFGRLPPSFLPMANRRLYEWQIESLRPYVNEIHLALPQDFVQENYDQVRLERLHIGIVSIENDVPLGHSVFKSVSALDKEVDDLWILFGDTLLTNMTMLEPESIAVGLVQEHSRWGYCRDLGGGAVEFCEKYDVNGDREQPVVVGCFRFSRGRFLKCLDLSGKDFYAALNLYSTKYGLKLARGDKHWFDFGHLHTYFRSRQNFTTERSFNSMHIEKRKVLKCSTLIKKIAAEAAWYTSVPRDIDVFLPSYLGRAQQSGVNGYAMEYLFLPSISDLFVFGKLPEQVWHQILSSCAEFFAVCGGIEGDEADNESLLASCRAMYEQKTDQRLRDFCKARDIDMDRSWTYNGCRLPSIKSIFHHALESVPPTTKKHLRISHGDFHFANIFFDFRSLGVKVIDPRGAIADFETIFGDHRYDLAKLAHSVCGLYDFIVAGILEADFPNAYEIDFQIEENRQTRIVKDLFQSMNFDGYKPNSKEIYAIMALLFLSMLPLHADNTTRQNTLLANAFRIYQDMERA